MIRLNFEGQFKDFRAGLPPSLDIRRFASYLNFGAKYIVVFLKSDRSASSTNWMVYPLFLSFLAIFFAELKLPSPESTLIFNLPIPVAALWGTGAEGFAFTRVPAGLFLNFSFSSVILWLSSFNLLFSWANVRFRSIACAYFFPVSTLNFWHFFIDMIWVV